MISFFLPIQVVQVNKSYMNKIIKKVGKDLHCYVFETLNDE